MQVILFTDNDPIEIPREFLDCLADEPTALRTFQSLTEAEQKQVLDRIYSAKKEETHVERMAEAVNTMAKGLKLPDN